MPEPTIINNTRGGGNGAIWAVVLVIALALLAAVFFGRGIMDEFSGSKIKVSVETPNADSAAPSAPATPAAPAAN